MTPEARTKNAVKKELDKAGVWYFMPAANGYGRAGIPDIICCINGYFLAIECKAGRGILTALQERELNKILAAGGAALVIYDDPSHFRALGTWIAALQLRKKHDYMASQI